MSGFLPRDLINEVKIRPGIYNKDVLEHPTREHKRQLWLEVAERLTPAEDWDTFTDVEKEVRMGEIATKWKNLKDHFYREIKLEEAGEAHKKRKYIYYDDMEFVRPFVGYKLPAMNKSIKNTNNDSMEAASQDFMTNTDADIDMEAFLNETEDTVEEEEEDDTKFVPNNSPIEEVRAKTKRVIKPTFKALQNKPSSSSPATTTNRLQKESIIKNFNVLKKTGGPNSNSTFKIRDGDITFCLSLVPTLRKLDDSRKLSAKIEILKVLRYYVDNNERRNLNNQTHVSNLDNTTSSQCDEIEEEDMNEEHLEEYEESVNIKQERRDDPLNGSGGGGGNGNTKIWWT